MQLFLTLAVCCVVWDPVPSAEHLSDLLVALTTVHCDSTHHIPPHYAIRYFQGLVWLETLLD